MGKSVWTFANPQSCLRPDDHQVYGVVSDQAIPVFGSFGMLAFVISLLAGLYAVFLKIFHKADFVQTPCRADDRDVCGRCSVSADGSAGGMRCGRTRVTSKIDLCGAGAFRIRSAIGNRHSAMIYYVWHNWLGWARFTHTTTNRLEKNFCCTHVRSA